MSFNAHNVVSFFRPRPARDWDNAELAQFYRVEAALRQAGIFVDTQRGLTDEGDPWFVYCRQDSDDVFLHIARFDGYYVAASPSMATPLWRRKFQELLDELVRDNPIVMPVQNRKPSTELYIHPSTMLIAAVAALFYKNTPLRGDDHGEAPVRQSESRGTQASSLLSEVYSAALVSAMAIIAVLHHTTAEDTAVNVEQQEELAFLDGIMFNRGESHDDLPRFEGNVAPSEIADGAISGDVQVAAGDQVVEADAQAHDAPSLLQGFFGKFALTLAAASAAVAAAEVTVANRESVHAAYGEEQAVPAQTRGASAVVVAAADKPVFQAPVETQQVSLTPTPESTPTDTTAVTTTLVATLMPELIILPIGTPGETPDDGPVTETPVVETPAEPEPVASIAISWVSNGLAVLLSPETAELVPDSVPFPTEVPLIGLPPMADPDPMAIA